MPIFKIKDKKLTRYIINQNGFGDEFTLRDLFSANLEELLGIRFIDKEYPILEGRIDTLGIDENDAPVIIEYKWKENEEILSQGLFYYNWLIKNKKHFELLVENKIGKGIKINWDQPRVILIAKGFSRYIIGAVQQQQNIELITYNYYQPDILHIENIYTPRNIKQNNKPKIAGSLPKNDYEPEYNLDYHLNLTSDKMKKLFNVLREKILELPGIEEKTEQKTGITYRTIKSFARFEFKATWIQVVLKEPQYKRDTLNLVKDVTKNNWGYKGLFKFLEDSDINYLFELIKQSYESTL